MNVSTGQSINFQLLKLALVAHSELVTALSTAGSQDLTAISRLHALAESMNALTAAIVRLEGTFHILLFVLGSARTAGARRDFY
jgi:hypothetical protein